MGKIDSSIIAALVKIVGDNYVLSDKVDLAVYESDAETLDVARADAVVLPASTEEVAAVVKLAHQHKIPFTARGAGTGLSGGATTVHGGISIVLSRMTKIIAVDPVDRVACVQTGVTNVAVSEAAKEHGLYFAPDPSSQTASTIGGNVAENAGGPHCLKYGMTTNHVLGLKVVLSDGSIVKLGGRARDRQSLDLVGLFVGSEGTLGIATEAYLKLIPVAKAVQTMLVYFPTMESAGRSVSAIIASGVIPAAMEMIDRISLNAVEDAHQMGLNRDAEALLIVELDGPLALINAQRELIDECLQKNQALSIKWAENDNERA
ncbi:MAG TPA: FAD-binding protein, partial [Chroococcales cyanobacterium]